MIKLLEMAKTKEKQLQGLIRSLKQGTKEQESQIDRNKRDILAAEEELKVLQADMGKL